MQKQLEEARAMAQEVTSAQEQASSLKGDVDNLKAQLEESSKKLDVAERASANLKVSKLCGHCLTLWTEMKNCQGLQRCSLRYSLKSQNLQLLQFQKIPQGHYSCSPHTHSWIARCSSDHVQ